MPVALIALAVAVTTLLVRSEPGPAKGGRLTRFEAGGFSRVDGRSATPGARLRVTREQAYEGSKAVKISYDGRPGNIFARAWFEVRWRRGSDVWYGAAFYVPDPTRLRYTDLIRWDNYETYGRRGDVGGLAVDEGNLTLFRKRYRDPGGSQPLAAPVPVPPARWFWVEVHQRFSDVDRRALTELYLDGQKVAESNAANMTGRRIDDVRYGYVYNWNEGGSSTIYMDRLSYSDRMRGPAP